MNAEFFKKSFKRRKLNYISVYIMIFLTILSTFKIKCDDTSLEKKIFGDFKNINNFFKNLKSLQKEIERQKLSFNKNNLIIDTDSGKIIEISLINENQSK